ncbi:hypothetical protein [Salipiger abyssi]|uniref:hypothetical protein n=1 Tax=Salipiger abyssi TaxID=1250539 RepID=UPI001A9009E9|nr:hypothetical protein [Salipiger abyssi]MBN9889626.1 hypothetical protein [Salipiger abyssi]
MISQAFSETGWQCAPTERPVTRYQVFGERSSGTNFVKRLIGRNTVLVPTEELGWKHALPHMTAIPADLAAICVVRHAGDWARSMHAKPWHCPPEMQRLPFSEFIRAEWATVADRARYFPQVKALGGVGAPLQLDRDPLTGAPYADLFALRRAKLQGLLSFFNRGCAVVFCRLEAVQAAPEVFLAELQAEFGLPPAPQPYRPVVKRLGAKFLASVEDRPETPSRFSAADLAFLRDRLDLEQEAALGYRY